MEIDRDRKSDRFLHGSVNIFFPKVFERYVSAQAESNEENDTILFCRVVYNGLQIVGRTTVIEPQLTVYFATAATVVPGHNIKAF